MHRQKENELPIKRRRVTRRHFVAATAAVVATHATAIKVPQVIASLSSQEWGDLTGRLVYMGKPPERQKLVVDRDVECCGKYDIRDESLMVGREGGLMNVFIYLRSRPARICSELAERMPEKVVLDNRDCIFIPHCMTVWYPRQKYHIINSDPIAQNVAFSPLGDRAANIIMTPPPDPAAEAWWEFRRSQTVPVLVKCNYHPWESAYVLPRDNPYMAVTGPDGSFQIEKLPVGKAEFQVWQERIGYLHIERWPKGRFEISIKPGLNDLGTIAISGQLFQV